jgi:kinesin family member 6/9
MTHVLRDALGGNCNTVMIGNIWCEKLHLDETISTLRFSTRMMCVTLSPEINIHYDPLALLKRYEKEIRELKQELSMHDTLAGRSHVQYEPYTEPQRQELIRRVKQFIEDGEEMEIASLRNVREMMAIFRGLYKQNEECVDRLGTADSGLSTQSRVATRKGSIMVAGSDFNTGQPVPVSTANIKPVIEDGVGDVEGTGFGIGVAGGRAVKLGFTAKPNPVKKPTDEEAPQDVFSFYGLILE